MYCTALPMGDVGIGAPLTWLPCTLLQHKFPKVHAITIRSLGRGEQGIHMFQQRLFQVFQFPIFLADYNHTIIKAKYAKLGIFLP